MLRASLERFESPESLDVYLTGGSFISDKSYEKIKEGSSDNGPSVHLYNKAVLFQRNHVIKAFLFAGFAQEKIVGRFSPQDHTSCLLFRVDDGYPELGVIDKEGKIIYSGDMREAPQLGWIGQKSI